MSELLPCPFCGAPAGIDVRDYTDDEADFGNAWCGCETCGAEQPYRKDASAAIAAWNRRAPGQDYARAVEDAALIADKWRDENNVAAAKARTREARLSALGMDHPAMAEQLDGAAIECNAIAAAIRELAQPIPAVLAAPGGAQPAPRDEAAAGEGDAT